jgi:hypothetical protein
VSDYERWAILWPSKNRLDGERRDLLGTPDTGMTMLFRTRQEVRDHPKVREFNEMLRRRPDLRAEPHGWKARRPVKVKVTIDEIR